MKKSQILPLSFLAFLVLFAEPLWAIKCGEVLGEDSLTRSNERGPEGNLLGNQFPELVYSIKGSIDSGEISDKKTFFILLPGNMGAVWEGTNHNVGYDMLVDLIKYYGAIGTESGSQSYDSPIEEVTFNAHDLGDDIDLEDTQVFFSQARFARTKSGELFYRRGSNDQPTLVFMRSYGFYNDVGDFFIPAIREMGGLTKNIIAVHDDLKVSPGQLLIEDRQATYNGNRAILSLHNNLNALSLNEKFRGASGEILDALFGVNDFKSSVAALNADLLLWNIEKTTWQTVVDVKNQLDPIQFKYALQKSLRSPVEEFIRDAVQLVESTVAEDLKELESLKSQIRTATDRKSAIDKLKEKQENLRTSNPQFVVYTHFKDMLADIRSKKSKTLRSIVQLFAEGFDPRSMNSPFTRIGVGTGYDEWVKNGNLNGLPPLPEGVDSADTGGFSHFVLSQKDPKVFDKLLIQRTIKTLDQLIQIKK